MEANPLTDREFRAWKGFHRLRGLLVGHLARNLARETGLTEADYAILVEVSDAPGQRARARDLCHALGWERSRFSHQIARMEARGSVKRSPCVDDARGFDVELTAAGMDAIKAAAPIHLAEVRRCFIDVLTPEQLDVLGDIAETVTARLANERTQCTDRSAPGEHTRDC